jgi:hypothetical protein
MRVEEVEDSEDVEYSVDLDPRAGGRRFVSDELQFTGIDIGAARTRRRRTTNTYEEDSYDSGDSDEVEYIAGPSDEFGQDMQLILREKEEMLVEQALERMRRARELGKTNVKLTRAQIDALERAERRQRLAAPPAKAPKSKKGAQTRPKLPEKKSSKSDRSSGNSPALKAIEPGRKGKSSTGAREVAMLPYPVLPDETYGIGSGAPMYTPQGYYAPPTALQGYYAPPTARSSSRPGSRTASSQSLRQQQPHSPPLPPYQHPYQHPYQQGRYYSNPDPYQARPPSAHTAAYPRPDPSDPNWEPRARSTSNLVSYPVDRYDSTAYSSQAPAPLRFDPNDPRFASPQARRVASGPPDMYPSHSPVRRQPQDTLGPYGNGPIATENYENEDSDDDAGVLVNVTEEHGGNYGVQTRASANAAAGNRGRGGGQVKRGTAKRTR